jgi:hypothetical protein
MSSGDRWHRSPGRFGDGRHRPELAAPAIAPAAAHTLLAGTWKDHAKDRQFAGTFGNCQSNPQYLLLRPAC